MRHETADQHRQHQGTPAKEPDTRRMIFELADGAATLGDIIPPDVRAIVNAMAGHRWSRK